jgi:hypothetical protein
MQQQQGNAGWDKLYRRNLGGKPGHSARILEWKPKLVGLLSRALVEVSNEPWLWIAEACISNRDVLVTHSTFVILSSVRTLLEYGAMRKILFDLRKP